MIVGPLGEGLWGREEVQGAAAGALGAQMGQMGQLCGSWP